jgi:hypothetical protein
VPEHDAFGRPVGEDPLAALRGATEGDADEAARARAEERARIEVEPEERARTETSADEARARIDVSAREPAEIEVPEAEPPPAQEPVPAAARVYVRPRRRRGRGVVILLVFAIVIVGAVPAMVAFVADEVRDRVDGVLVPPTQGGAARAPTGLERTSLIRRANFARALEVLRRENLGRALTMRVAPDRIDATLTSGRGRVSQVQVTFTGTLRRFGDTRTGTEQRGLALDRIDPRAPERLVRAGARRTDQAAREIDYLVLNQPPALRWGAYFKGGAIVQGDARGRPRRVL